MSNYSDIRFMNNLTKIILSLTLIHINALAGPNDFIELVSNCPCDSRSFTRYLNGNLKIERYPRMNNTIVRNGHNLEINYPNKKITVDFSSFPFTADQVINIKNEIISIPTDCLKNCNNTGNNCTLDAKYLFLTRIASSSYIPTKEIFLNPEKGMVSSLVDDFLNLFTNKSNKNSRINENSRNEPKIIDEVIKKPNGVNSARRE